MKFTECLQKFDKDVIINIIELYFIYRVNMMYSIPR